MTEADAETFVKTFRGIAGRAVVISSGDVYRAYGRLQRRDSGPPDPTPLAEDAPLRESRYLYRNLAPDGDHWMAHYDKILVEQTLMVQTDLPATILRFPAVLGPNEYRRSACRFTQGFAEDVAQAVVLAVATPAAAGQIYNVRESWTPTMAKRLAEFARVIGWRGDIVLAPASQLPEVDRLPYDFAHHIVYDTTRIRSELGYAEVIPHKGSLARTVELERG